MTDFFIRRPIASTVISLILLLLGLVGIQNLPIRYLPQFNSATIQISTNYAGAPIDVMQGYVTRTIEQALQGISGIDYISSSSTLGNSSITVHLQLNADPNVAATDIMEQVSSIQGKLPQNADQPIVKKVAAQNDFMMVLSFSSDQIDQALIADYINRVINPNLQAIDGVGDLQIWGPPLSMRLWLDPQRMAAVKLSMPDVLTALMQQNLISAAGATQGQSISVNLNALTDIHTPEQFNQLVVSKKGNTLIHLHDIGFAAFDQRVHTVAISFEGKPAVFMAVSSAPGANVLEVAGNIKKIMPELQKSLPQHLKMQIMYDATLAVQASIEEVISSLTESALIVIAVIFLFLGDWRAILIPAVTIPLSLIGVCFILDLAGFSLNTLTLLAMVLAIGLVVDDAIVVVENIFRHLEEGLTPLQAAIQGAREITGPIIAMTITLASVYAPIIFIGGLTGALFTEFTVTLSAAVLLSGLIALTLSPMMCSQFLSPATLQKKLVQRIDHSFERLRTAYRRVLTNWLKTPRVPLLIWLCLLPLLLFAYTTGKKELAPSEDTGYLLVSGQMPGWNTLDYGVRYAKKLNPIYDQLADREHSMWVVGVPTSNQLISFITFKPWQQRQSSTIDYAMKLQAEISKNPGWSLQVLLPPAINITSGLPFQLVLSTVSGTYQDLDRAANQLIQAGLASGNFFILVSDLKFDQAKATFVYDRNRSEDLGINGANISTSLGYLVAESSPQQFTLNTRAYDVVTQALAKNRQSPDDLLQYQIPTAKGTMIPLQNLGHWQLSSQPASQNEMNQQNSVTIQGSLAPWANSQQVIQMMQQELAKNASSDMHLDFTGQLRLELQEGSRMLLAFAIAFLMIFLVLAFQFESWRDPLIILLGSVPMSLFGALLFIWTGFTSINIYSQIGLLTLIGLISKHGILMVKFANQLRAQQGMDITSAIIEASAIRLRAILMTTAATVVGVVPLLHASGAGAHSRFAIGLVISTGLTIGTLMTLFIVPGMYYWLASRKQPVVHQANAT